MDLRHRSRPKQSSSNDQACPAPPPPTRRQDIAAQADNRDVDPRVASGSRHTRYELAVPRQTGRGRDQGVPPAPIVPDHVASHYTNGRLLNGEQEYWARERQVWKDERLHEARELERDQPRRTVRAPIDAWRRDVAGPHSSRAEQSRQEEPGHQERRNVPGRRHRHDAPVASRAPETFATIGPRNSRNHRTSPPDLTQSAHRCLARDQQLDGEESDPFDERALELECARLNEADRRARDMVDPIPRSDLRGTTDVRRVYKRAWRNCMAYILGDMVPTKEMWDYMGYRSDKFAEQRVYDALNDEDDRKYGSRRPPGHDNAPWPFAHDEPRHHRNEAAPTAPPRQRQPKPIPDVGRGRPPPAHTMKDLPSLPSFPSFPSSGEAGPSRDHHQPSRRSRATHIQTPPDDPPTLDPPRVHRDRRVNKNLSERYAEAQIEARKREMKRIAKEVEELEAAKARRERKKR
jgi:hypothetical protein